MSYAVLARRYRSQSFDALVGQESIAKTLRNAIAADRVAHAYLFTGTRGVGKTSAARIFAKALNAPDDQPKDVADAIMQGRDTDVIEIDAASNRGVDEARELIANCVYRPLRGRKKIYIIDEVHMLTREAFNALLKTMEEPPEHVVFILCTTDAHKVPATIQSRCQRFDFKNIPTAKIADHLAELIKAEGFTADSELIHTVARMGEGSMRDALSLLDRLLAGGEKKLTLKLLEDLFGLPERGLILALVDALAEGNHALALEKTDELLSRGNGVEQILSTLSERFRDLMVLASCGPKTTLVDLTDSSRAEAITQSQKFDPAGLVHMIALCDSSGRAARSSPSPRAVLDAVIVRLAMTEKLADVTALVAGGAAAANGTPVVTTRPSGTTAKKA